MYIQSVAIEWRHVLDVVVGKYKNRFTSVNTIILLLIKIILMTVLKSHIGVFAVDNNDE